MSRRLVITLLILLIVGVIGGTTVLVVQRLQNAKAPTDVSNQEGQLEPALPGGQQPADPSDDDDADGLTNADEQRWSTNATNPDTDNDGVSDGQEVQSNRNPTIAGPNDSLPKGFEPGRDVTPIEPAPIEELDVGQFFIDEKEFLKDTKNLTEEYNKQYPEEERNDQTLFIFASRQPIELRLPNPAGKAIKIAKNTSPELTQAYIELARQVLTVTLEPVFDRSLKELFDLNDPSAIRGMAFAVRLYQERLIDQRIPPKKENFHKLLLGYTQLLALTLDQIAVYNDDKVRSLVGIRQFRETQDEYLPLFREDLKRT